MKTRQTISSFFNCFFIWKVDIKHTHWWPTNFRICIKWHVTKTAWKSYLLGPQFKIDQIFWITSNIKIIYVFKAFKITDQKRCSFTTCNQKLIVLQLISLISWFHSIQLSALIAWCLCWNLLENIFVIWVFYTKENMRKNIFILHVQTHKAVS